MLHLFSNTSNLNNNFCYDKKKKPLILQKFTVLRFGANRFDVCHSFKINSFNCQNIYERERNDSLQAIKGINGHQSIPMVKESGLTT